MTSIRFRLASEILRLNPDCPASTLAEALACSEGYAHSLRTFNRKCDGNAEAMREMNNESSRRCRAGQRAPKRAAA